jgi:hypothetical protein
MMEVTLQAHEFIRHFLGVPLTINEHEVQSVAREVLPYLSEPDDWIKLLFNPDLRAKTIAILLWVNRRDDDMEWSLLFTRLESLLEENTVKKFGKHTLEQCATLNEAILILRSLFQAIGRETATVFTNELLAYVLKKSELKASIETLAVNL